MQLRHDELFEPVVRLVVNLVAFGKILDAEGDVSHGCAPFP
jgi:hypothetical protein